MDAKFQKPNAFERWMNRLLGRLVAHGLGPGYMRLLETRGRKSGQLYTTPVNVLEHAGKLWLVAPRGRTQWSRNAEANGELSLRRGAKVQHYTVRSTELAERPALLKRYLETYSAQVQRYFQVQAAAPVEDFAAVAEQHPVYELLPA